MSHFVCTGECNGVSETPGTCQAENCSFYGVPLKECSCDDGQHAQVKKAEENQE